MNAEQKESLAASIMEFKLPRYHEIPDVGLFLEQTSKYIGGYLEGLPNISLTGSMISNYVKKDLIANPVKKQYNREQIAYLIFAAIAKSVLSLEQIHLLFELQAQTYPSAIAYDYFCDEFENVLQHVFGLKDSLENVGSTASDEKVMLRNTIITVAHKIYLDKVFSLIEENRQEEISPAAKSDKRD